MNTWKVILATLVIFGTGVVTGGLLVVYSDSVLKRANKPESTETPKPIATAQAPAPGPGPGQPREGRPALPQNFLLRKEFLERLDHELKLTPVQFEHIEKIISEGQERIKELSQQIDPQVRGELAATRERIRAELNPGQRVLYAELLKRRPMAPPRDHPTNAPPAMALPEKTNK